MVYVLGLRGGGEPPVYGPVNPYEFVPYEGDESGVSLADVTAPNVCPTCRSALK